MTRFTDAVRFGGGGLLAAVVLAGCGSDPKQTGAGGADEPVPYAQIDHDKWRAALVGTGAVRDNPDLEALYELTLDDCAEDDLAIQLSLSGSQPDVTRINLTYVCPSQAHKVDDALASLQNSMDKYERLCAMDPADRTREEQDYVEAVSENKDDCN